MKYAEIRAENALTLKNVASGDRHCVKEKRPCRPPRLVGQCNGEHCCRRRRQRRTGCTTTDSIEAAEVAPPLRRPEGLCSNALLYADGPRRLFSYGDSIACPPPIARVFPSEAQCSGLRQPAIPAGSTEVSDSPSPASQGIRSHGGNFRADDPRDNLVMEATIDARIIGRAPVCAVAPGCGLARGCGSASPRRLGSGRRPPGPGV